MTQQTVGIIGLGNLGSAVAQLLANNGAKVVGWEFNTDIVKEVNERHSNEAYLAGVTLSKNIVATHDIGYLLEHVSTVFITLPSRFLPSALAPLQAQMNQAAWRHIGWVNMSKGLFADSGKTSFQVLSEICPLSPKAMLSGPSLANEITQGVPTAIVVASDHEALSAQVESLLGNAQFSVVKSDDVVGVELGGILKNIYAMGLGFYQAQSVEGLNFAGAYLTQALNEMKSLGVALGAKATSFDGLAGLGDLVTTALSGQSHNVKFGQLLGQGLPLKDIEEAIGVLPEGYNALMVAMQLAEAKGVDMPLATMIQQVIKGELEVKESLAAFSRVFS